LLHSGNYYELKLPTIMSKSIYGYLISYPMPDVVKTYLAEKKIKPLGGLSTKTWESFAGKHYFIVMKTPDHKMTVGKVRATHTPEVGWGTAASDFGTCGSAWVTETGLIMGVHIVGDKTKNQNGCLRLNQ